jgi:hypothetical protein
LIGIHPGCGASRPWHSKGYAELCDTLQEKFGAKVVISGGPRERAKAREIISLCKRKPINLVEKTSLLELAALIKRSNLYVGVDTGPVHLAAALGTPLIMLILAKNVKPVRWGPWKTKHILLYPHPESHCPIYCDPGRCSVTYCINALSAEKVINAVDQIINRNISTTAADWEKMSFNVLLVSQQNAAAEKIILELNNTGFRVTLLPPEQIKGIKGILKIIEKENILVIHQLGNQKCLTVSLANLLSGIYTTNATVLVRDIKEGQSILCQYHSAFQKSLL